MRPMHGADARCVGGEEAMSNDRPRVGAVGAFVALLLLVGGMAMPASAGVVPAMTTAVRNVEFVVFDTETTGFSAKYDNIVEIGAVRIRNGEIVEERTWLINPQRSIPRRASNVHGIFTATVRNSPTFAEVYPEFLEFIGNSVLIAHNARFDIGMLRAEAERNHLEAPHNVVIDSLKLFRSWYPQASSYKLAALAGQLGIEGDGFHRGMADSRYAALILFAGLQEHPRCNTLRKLFSAAGGMMVF